jgi:5-aminolevulinate synthase
MDYDSIFQHRLNGLKRDGAYRSFAELERPAGKYPHAVWHSPGGPREVVIWCSNDYLGMGHHPAVQRAMRDAIDAGATGAGGTRNIAGTHHLHVQLERTIASLHNKPAALTFTSGYAANLTTLAVLGSLLPGCVILSDADNHNSMIEGIRRSGAAKVIFKHNDMDDLGRKLTALPRDQAKIVVFESVYSMSGAIAPVREMAAVAKRHGALTYLDEVHAVGMYGRRGGGIAQMHETERDIDVLQGTLGKAFGLAGGYIAGNEALVDCVRSFGHGFIFSTAPPPVIAAGARASIEHLARSNVEREAQQKNVAALKAALREAGIPALPSPSHIVPIVVGDAVKVKRLTDLLLHDYGTYVQPINHPTVPRGMERIRLTPGPFHTPDLLEHLMTALNSAWRELALPYAHQNVSRITPMLQPAT